jgi:L-threonylcarbamoyladenylate synthase
MIIKNNKINNALEQLRKGNIIIYPTDTIYGFGVDATNSLSIKKLNILKGRQTPLSIMINNIKSIEKYAFLDQKQSLSISKILPGPYTILLKARKSILSKLVQQGSKKIGIRIPKNEFCLKLLSEFNAPIITTSVNKHGEKSINDINLIEKIFFDINIYEDNINKNSKGSTIVDFTETPYKVIRNGEGLF